MKAEFYFAGEPVAFAVAEPAPATRQNIFDRVVRHYRKQPRQCSYQGQCRYWLKGDERCFVGALMSEAEAKNVPAVSIDSAIESGRAPAWMEKHEEFLMSIQFLHDTKSNWADGRMPMVLELFAAERGLAIPA